jgi:hypothetical protein
MIQEQIPSTQNTLYSRFANAPMFHEISFARHAKSLGYPYFEWNEKIYEIDYSSLLAETRLVYKDTNLTYQHMIEAGV